MEDSPTNNIVPPSQSGRKVRQAPTLSGTANTSTTSASPKHEHLETPQAERGSTESTTEEQVQQHYGIGYVISTPNECPGRRTSVRNPSPPDVHPAGKPTSSDSRKGDLPTILVSDLIRTQGHLNKAKRKSSAHTRSDGKAAPFNPGGGSSGKEGMGSKSPKTASRKEKQTGGNESDHARLQAPKGEHSRHKSPLAQQGRPCDEPKGVAAPVSASRRQASKNEPSLSDVGSGKCKAGSPGFRKSRSTRKEGTGSGVRRKNSTVAATTRDTGNDFHEIGAATSGTAATTFLSVPKRSRRHSFPGRTEEVERADDRTEGAARPVAEGNLSCPTEFLLLSKSMEDESTEKTLPGRRTETSIGISSIQLVGKTCSSSPGKGADGSKATSRTSPQEKLSGSTLPAFLAAVHSRVSKKKPPGRQEPRRTASFSPRKSKTSVISSRAELCADGSQPRETRPESGASPCFMLPSSFVTAAGDGKAQEPAGSQEIAHADRISSSASAAVAKPLSSLGEKDSSRTTATPLAAANVKPGSRHSSLTAVSAEGAHAENFKSALELGHAAEISSNLTATSAHTSSTEVGGPQVAGAPADDNSAVRIRHPSHPSHCQTRENVYTGKLAERRESGYDGSILLAQSQTATSSSTKNVAGSSRRSVITRRERVGSGPALVSLPTGNIEVANSENSSRLSAAQETACIPPAQTGAATTSSNTECQFSVTQASTMLQNAQLPPVPASPSQHAPAESQSSDPGKSAAANESGYGKRLLSVHSEAALLSSTATVANNSNTSASAQELHKSYPFLVDLLTGKTKEVNADNSTRTSGYRNNTQDLPTQPITDSYHWPSEDVTQGSEPLQQEHGSPQQAYAIVQAAAEQWLSTSTDQDSGTHRDTRETLQPHHNEHSKQSSMHQQTGTALPQSAPPFDSRDAGMLTQRLNHSDSVDSVADLESDLLEEIAAMTASQEAAGIVQQGMHSSASDNSILGVETTPEEAINKLKASLQAVEQELSFRRMTQQEMNSRTQNSSLHSLGSPPLQEVARVQANQQALQLESSRRGIMHQRIGSSVADYSVPALPPPTQEQAAWMTGTQRDSPQGLLPSRVGQATLFSRSSKKPASALETPYVGKNAMMQGTASVQEQALQLEALKKLSTMHRQRRPRSLSASSKMERHSSDHIASVLNASCLPVAAKPRTHVENEDIEHSSLASYNEDTAAERHHNMNYGQRDQLATTSFVRRASQQTLRSSPNMISFNASDFPPANRPLPQLSNTDLQLLNESDTQKELEVSKLVQAMTMPMPDPASNANNGASTAFVTQPSLISLSTPSNALPKGMPFSQTTYFPCSTTSQAAQHLVRDVPYSITTEQSYEHMQPHPTHQQLSFMPPQEVITAPSHQVTEHNTSTEPVSYAQGTPLSTFSASSHDTPYVASSLASENTEVPTHNMPHSSTTAHNYEHYQQFPTYQHSSFLQSQGAITAISDQGPKGAISTGPILYAQDTPSSYFPPSSYDTAYSASTTSEGAQAFLHNMPHTDTAEQNYENTRPRTTNQQSSFLQSHGAIEATFDQETKRTTSTGSILCARGTRSSSFSGSSYDIAYSTSTTSERAEAFPRNMPHTGTAERNHGPLQLDPTYQRPNATASQVARAVPSDLATTPTVSTAPTLYAQETAPSSFAASPYDTAYFASSSASESAQVITPNMLLTSPGDQSYEHMPPHPTYQQLSLMPSQGAAASPSDQEIRRTI
ncbi:pneumococcal serine-rich repeat protein-like [Dermacentor albipictus]|uniref:pneumococcal serine-rich repeat protein-like n=1 Tax=Dermacentor albipictus TaxID=60249 RepID=UPI0031FBFA83